MSLTNLKTLAYDILKSIDDDLVRDSELTRLPLCLKCNNKIISIPLKQLTVLQCAHVIHKDCFEEKTLPSTALVCPFPECEFFGNKQINNANNNNFPSHNSSQSSTSSLVKELERLQIGQISSVETNVVQERSEKNSAQNQEMNMSNSLTNSKKRLNKDNYTEKLPCKKVKVTVENGKSRKLQRLIQELSTDNTQTTEAEEREALQKEAARGKTNNSFFDLYLRISNAEMQNDEAHHQLLLAYFLFGEELMKRTINYYLHISSSEKS